MKTVSKLALGTSLAIALNTPAFAQTHTHKKDEVIVTATKRAENIQDVPISISAYGAEFIEDSGVVDLRDIALYSPNFTIGSSSQLSNNRIAIRGVGSVGNAGIEPSVGVFIDGVYYPRPGSVIGNLMDLEAVEVLRGPQGTLFGRNTPMGALNVRTKDPVIGVSEGYITAGYGNYNAWNAGGAVNLPLGEEVAVRVSGKYSQRDGFGDNLLTGENYGARDDLNLRGKLLWEPSDHFSAKLSGDYGKINSGGGTIEYLNNTNSQAMLNTLTFITSLDPDLADITPANLLTDDPYDHDIYQKHDDDLDDKQWGIAAELDYALANGIELKSITSKRSWDAGYYESAIRLPISLFPRLTDYENDTFSQEFQILSPTGGDFDWLAGLFYYKEDYYISQDFDLGTEFCAPTVQGVVLQQALTGTGLFTATGPLPFAVASNIAAGQAAACDAGTQSRASDSEFNQDLESIAIFGQGTYHATETVSFTLGGRYTKDDKTADFTNVVTNPFVDQGLGVRVPESHLGMDIDEAGDTEAFTYFANISYDISPDTMLFGTVSTGYKSGGFNTDGVGINAETGGGLTREERIFGPEDTTNYEFGFKSTVLDGALQMNVTAYRMDIKGFQDRAFDGTSFVTRNVGKLRQQGVEGDMTLNPLDGLSFMGGFSYLDSDFRDYTGASPLPGQIIRDSNGDPILSPNGNPQPLLQDLTGERAHFAPKWQWSLVGNWEDDLNENMGYFLRGEAQNVGTQNIGGNTNQNPQSVQEGYTLLNARIGLRGDNDIWELSLWGKNLGGKGYCMTIFDQPFASNLGGVDSVAGTSPQRCAVGAPATYGAEFTVRY